MFLPFCGEGQSAGLFSRGLSIVGERSNNTLALKGGGRGVHSTCSRIAKDGKGYPADPESGKVQPLSEVDAISDAFPGTPPFVRKTRGLVHHSGLRNAYSAFLFTGITEISLFFGRQFVRAQGSGLPLAPHVFTKFMDVGCLLHSGTRVFAW